MNRLICEMTEAKGIRFDDTGVIGRFSQVARAQRRTKDESEVIPEVERSNKKYCMSPKSKGRLKISNNIKCDLYKEPEH